MGKQQSKSEQKQEDNVVKVSSLPDQHNEFESGGFHLVEIHGATAAFTITLVLTLLLLLAVLYKVYRSRAKGRAKAARQALRALRDAPNMEQGLLPGHWSPPGYPQGFHPPGAFYLQPPVSHTSAPAIRYFRQSSRIREVEDEALPHFGNNRRGQNNNISFGYRGEEADHHEERQGQGSSGRD